MLLHRAGDIVSDKTYEMTMLFDFFGELLTEKQREYFDLYYNEDLSLSEIAENAGISRQGVRDFICRAEDALVQTEQKTGIIQKHLYTQAELSDILDYVSEIRKISNDDRISLLADIITAKLESLKEH